ncbi:MAG: metal-dependent hydrolase [Zetaproteobacteria bacterium CG1_02_49_23]|nr:MAG: metal-dependent hydrolase [Zetaproteobacteria bacterium CG1_02_49_23]
MHCHIACLSEDNGCFVSDSLRNNYRFPIYIRAMGTSIEELQEDGDQVIADRLEAQLADSEHVSAAVLLALDGVVDNGELDRDATMLYVPNAYVAEQARTHPHLYFGASINPYRDDALQRLERVKRDGAVLVKWIPSIMNIDPADEALIPFYEKMKALNLPLLTHAGDEHSFTAARNEFADPRRLELPARLGVKVIAAHIATTGENDGVSNFELLLPLMQQYPNLYADISSLTQINKLGYLNRALQVEGLEAQLIYGTDWPLQFSPLVSPWYFPLNLTVKQMWQLSNVENQWDRDVLLKQALGVPGEVFGRSWAMLVGMP